MLGTVINSLAIIIGGLIGLILKKGIKEEYRNTIMDAIGLSVLVIGVTGAIISENMLLVIGSMVVGSFIGEWIKIERKLDNLGDKLQSRFSSGDSTFSQAFVTSSLIYCVGAMAIIGSLEAGIQGDNSTLFVKSILDGITSMLFASSLGIGVIFSAIPVFIYQGSITLLANRLAGLLTPVVINEMSAVGGLLIMAIGINILGLKKIKVGNMLPAIFLPVIYYLILGIINIG